MARFLLDSSAAIRCVHGGTVALGGASPRVTIHGRPVATQASDLSIIGCPASPACTGAHIAAAATRVRSGGVPLLLADGATGSSSSGAGLEIIDHQRRVKGK